MKQNPHLPGTPDEFIENNLKLAQSIAWKYIKETYKNPSGFEMDDLLGISYLGLVKAYQGFDPTNFRGEDGDIKFSTYAVPKIHGEIRRHLRDYNSMIRPNRNYRELMNKENPTEKELQRIDSYLRTRSVESLNKTISSDDSEKQTIADIIEVNMDEDFEQIVVRDFVSSLNQKQKRVYILRMKYGLSQLQSAKVLGISQVGVSRNEIEMMNKARVYGEERMCV